MTNQTQGQTAQEKVEAQTRLMAHAKELLEACKKAVLMIPECTAVRVLEQAIAKAEGRG